jgi:hypothetical protein
VRRIPVAGKKYIESLYSKRFGKERPDTVESIESMAER